MNFKCYVNNVNHQSVTSNSYEVELTIYQENLSNPIGQMTISITNKKELKPFLDNFAKTIGFSIDFTGKESDGKESVTKSESTQSVKPTKPTKPTKSKRVSTRKRNSSK